MDEHGDTLSLVWFKGVQWVARNLPVGQPCVLWGRVSEYKGGVNMAHPEVLTMQEARSASALHPVYSSTERLGRFGLNSNGLAKAVQRLIGHLRKVHGEDWIPETLPPGILAMRGMPALAVALDHVHQPADVQAERLGRFRLKFEEFLFLQLLNDFCELDVRFNFFLPIFDLQMVYKGHYWMKEDISTSFVPC